MDYANPDSAISDEERVAYIKRYNPGMSDADALNYLDTLFARREQKQELLSREFSNRLAEKFLDKQGWARPFGWRTVFFYPDSNTPRRRYVVIAILAVGFLMWKML